MLVDKGSESFPERRFVIGWRSIIGLRKKIMEAMMAAKFLIAKWRERIRSEH